MRIRMAMLAAGVAAITISCGDLGDFYSQKSQSGPESGPSQAPGAAPSYQTVRTQVFAPRCLSCHSASAGNEGGINLETYDSAHALAGRIDQKVYVEKSMPPAPSQPLSDADRELVHDWAQSGASP